MFFDLYSHTSPTVISWFLSLSVSVFQVDTGNGGVQKQELQMEENQIYVSRDESECLFLLSIFSILYFTLISS